MIYIGIDPGLDGAIAAIDPTNGRMHVFDMPTLAITRGKTKKREIDAHIVRHIFSDFDGECAVYIEQSGPMGHDGAMQAWKTGCGWGIVYGVVVGLRLPVEIVTVQRWKKAMKATADKDLSRKLAMSAFPNHAHLFSRKKDDGRAEAVLIALYGSGLATARGSG